MNANTTTRFPNSHRITNHEEHTHEAVVTIDTGEVIRVPLDRSSGHLDWYYEQVCAGVTKHLLEAFDSYAFDAGYFRNGNKLDDAPIPEGMELNEAMQRWDDLFQQGMDAEYEDRCTYMDIYREQCDLYGEDY